MPPPYHPAPPTTTPPTRPPRRIHCILSESHSSYLIQWAGIDAHTGTPRPTWEPRANVPASAIAHWEDVKAGNARPPRMASVRSGAAGGVRGGEWMVVGVSAAVGRAGGVRSGSAGGGGGGGSGAGMGMGVVGGEEGVVGGDGDGAMAGGTTDGGVGVEGDAGVGSRGVGAAACAGGGGGVVSVHSAGFAGPECRDAGAVMPAAAVHSTAAPPTNASVASSEAATTPAATVVDIAVSTILQSLHRVPATAVSSHSTSDLRGPARATVSSPNSHNTHTDTAIAAATPPSPATISERAVKAVEEAAGIMYAVEVVCAAAGARCVDFASARAESGMGYYNTSNTILAAGEAGCSGDAPSGHYAQHPPDTVDSTMTMDLPTDDETATDATSGYCTPSHSSGSTYQGDDDDMSVSVSAGSDSALDTPADIEERPPSPTTVKRSILVHHMIYLNTQFDALEAEFHECVRGGDYGQALRVRERMGGIVVCLGGARMALALEGWV